MNTVKVENCKTLFIGRRGENEVTEVVFDFTEWQEQFGTGVIDLYVKRNLDVDAYPVVLSVDGTVATWLVTAADTDVVGNGKIEFVYTVNEKIAKSAVFPFFVGEDIGESSPEPPEHYQSWLEQLTELGAETQANAQAAAQSASEAAESAAQVAEDSNNAEAWAVGERNGEPVSEDDPTYNNNAKYWAENARANAPVQSVNGEDGDVVLTLDNIPNGETYARATPEQLAQIATNSENIASIGAIADTALQPEDLTPYRTAAQQSVIDNDLNSKINGNIGRIADINAKIPFNASTSNKLVDQNSFDSKLSDYRTAARQDIIDNNKQTKITANGILKGNGNGGVSAAVAGIDYLPTSALYAYRSANAQDAIDNAQNDRITALEGRAIPEGGTTGQVLKKKSATDYDTEWADDGGGGSTTLTAGDGIDISDDVISNTQGIEYIVGAQTAATSAWTGNSTDEALKVGKIIAYSLPYAGTATAATLRLTMADGSQTQAIPLRLKPSFNVTTQFPAGSIIILIYDGTYWFVSASYDTDTNTYPTGYCVTNGSVAAKAAACSFGYRGDTNYFPCLFRYANTAADATLAITTYAPEAAPIYVNGQRTSATNTFSAGVILFLYYNGAYYCYNDGRFPILVDGAVTSVQEYAAGLLVNYRTAAAQDTIDAGKQAKITATGILKGDGAGGVSSATAGTDYATPQQVNAKYTKPADGIPTTDMTAAVQASLRKADTALQAVPVTSVNGQTGDVTIQPATDAQVTTAVNTWLGENVAQETGYVLDASLTMSNAAPPASAVGDLKSHFNDNLVPLSWAPAITQKSYIRFSDGTTARNASGVYARTTSLKNISGVYKAVVVNNPLYEYAIALYDETGALDGTGYLGHTEYSTGLQYIPKTASVIGVSFRRVDQTALTDSDITAISAALSAFAATDTTLSVAGAAADAKGTGEAIESVSQIASQNASDIGDLKAEAVDPLFDKLIRLPDDDNFFDKGELTETGTYTKLSKNSFSISGGSGTAYCCYPLHGTNRVFIASNSQLPTRLLATDFAEIPANGAWSSTTYSLGMQLYCEANTTASNRKLELVFVFANIQNGEIVGTPEIVTSSVTNNKEYGSTILRLRGFGYAPLEQYTHYAIFARSRSRASSAVATMTLKLVQSPRLLQYILYAGNVVETSLTAAYAHALNSYILNNDRLYKVISPISVGDEIVVGTNVEQTSILEQFVENDRSFGELKNTLTPEIAWELGTIDGTTGDRDSDNSTSDNKITRIRGFSSFSPLSDIGYLDIKPGYKFSLREYDRNGNFITTPLGWTSTSQYFNFNRDHVYRFVAAYADDRPILPEDAPLTVTYTVAYDGTVETDYYNRLERNPIIQSRYSDSDRKSLTLLHYSDIHASLYSMCDIQAFYDRNYNIIDDIINTGDLVNTGARVTANGNTVEPFSPDVSYNVGDFLTYGGYLYKVTQAFSGEMKLSGYCEYWGRLKHENSVNAYYQMPLGQKSLFVIGNHDTNICNYSAAETPVNNHKAMGKAEALERYYANIDSWGVVRPSTDVCYYYKDYSTQKIRLICLDVQFWDSTELAWLETTLAGAKTAGYGVIVAAHCVPGAVTGYTDTNFTSYNYPDSDGGDYTVFGRYTNGAAIPAIQSFIEDGGAFICWMCGHNHRNRIAKCTNSPNITVVQIENAGNFNTGSLHENSRTGTGVYSRTCANAVSFNTEDKLIKIVRFGTNIDSHMRKADYLCFDYATRQVIV